MSRLKWVHVRFPHEFRQILRSDGLLPENDPQDGIRKLKLIKRMRDWMACQLVTIIALVFALVFVALFTFFIFLQGHKTIGKGHH